jgi:hypothetical protein
MVRSGMDHYNTFELSLSKKKIKQHFYIIQRSVVGQCPSCRKYVFFSGGGGRGGGSFKRLDKAFSN